MSNVEDYKVKLLEDYDEEENKITTGLDLRDPLNAKKIGLNSDYYSLKTLETKLNSAKNALDRLSEENGSNIHGAHLMEVSQSRYENALRLRNGFEFSKSLVETSYNANAKYYKDTFEEEFVPRSVQADRKAIAGHQNKVKIWKKQITSNFSLKPAGA